MKTFKVLKTILLLALLSQFQTSEAKDELLPFSSKCYSRYCL